MKMRLSLRLFISYAAIAVVGGVVAYLTISLLAPRLFEDRLGMMMDSEGTGMSMGAMDATSVRSAFLSALTTSLIVGVLASVIAAGFVAAAVTGRLLRPLNAVRAATKLIAAGKYGGRVPWHIDGAFRKRIGFVIGRCHYKIEERLSGTIIRISHF